MKVQETCGCGAGFVWEGDGRYAEMYAAREIRAWRSIHTHHSRRLIRPLADEPGSNTELHRCDSHEVQRANGGDGR